MLNDWRVQELEERLVLKKKTSQVTLPEIEIIIDDSLGFTIYVYEWLLPETHELYTTNLRSITNITVSDLVKSINTLSITIWLVKQCRASCNSKVGWSLFLSMMMMMAVYFHTTNIAEFVVVQFFFLDRVQNSAVVFTCLTDCELRWQCRCRDSNMLNLCKNLRKWSLKYRNQVLELITRWARTLPVFLVNQTRR